MQIASILVLPARCCNSSNQISFLELGAIRAANKVSVNNDQGEC